jgi:integrase
VPYISEFKVLFYAHTSPTDQNGRAHDALCCDFDVDFHSIRKTVSTQLEQAGVSEGISADILGHEKKTMTYGLYSGGSSMEQKTAAINLIDYELS